MCLIYTGNTETVHFKTERFCARIYISRSVLDVGQINGIFHWYCSARIHKITIILHRLHSFNLTKTTKIQCVMHGAVILIVYTLTFSLSCNSRDSCFPSNAWFLPTRPQGLTRNNSKFLLNFYIQWSVYIFNEI